MMTFIGVLLGIAILIAMVEMAVLLTVDYLLTYKTRLSSNTINNILIGLSVTMGLGLMIPAAIMITKITEKI
jgi:hypothetical protein